MKQGRLYIGIDPGKTGFITFAKDGHYSFSSIPKIKGTNDVDYRELYLIFHNKIGDLIFEISDIKVAIEDVGGRGGWSATNNFNFGYIAGVLRGVISPFVLNENVIMVRPQKWQSFVRKGYPDLRKASSTGKTQIRDPKAVAKMIVEKEFPEIDFRKSTRAKKVDDNKIDSFLICQYLIRTDE